MKNEPAINDTISAAVYLVVGPEEHQKIFADSHSLHFTSREDAIAHIRPTALTQNQRIALFAYLYLYSKLHHQGQDSLSHAQKALSIPNGITANLESTITQPRIDYIRKLFKEKHRSHAEIFNKPDGFIAKMIEDVAYADVPTEKKVLKGLKASEYEHKWDRDGIKLMESQSTFGDLVKKYNVLAYEATEIVRLTGSNYQVTKDNLPHVHNALEEVCEVLGVDTPLLYIESGGINASTIGTETPIICLYSGCLSLLSHDELLFILGHEVGHIKSRHFQYHTMARAMANIGEGIVSLASSAANLFAPGMGKVVELAANASGLTLEGTLMAWRRMSELTADRAGLLACQNPDAAFTTLTKMAGYPLKYYNSISPKDILKQARAFVKLDNDPYNQFVKFEEIFDSSHPWPIMRARELDRWNASGSYRALVNRKAGASDTNEDGDGSSGIKVAFGGDGSKPTDTESKKPSGTGISIQFN